MIDDDVRGKSTKPFISTDVSCREWSRRSFISDRFGFPYRGDSTRPADMACGGSLSAVATLCSTEDCGITVHRWFVYYTGVSYDTSYQLVMIRTKFLFLLCNPANKLINEVLKLLGLSVNRNSVRHFLSRTSTTDTRTTKLTTSSAR
ncbi:hypothetical protein BC827DRAFT_655617 [Russula dissimulans]|nr:hypothetical protein BC827DRAFT_655617 [Russula dissimulans]